MLQGGAHKANALIAPNLILIESNRFFSTGGTSYEVVLSDEGEDYPVSRNIRLLVLLKRAIRRRSGEDGVERNGFVQDLR